MPPKNPLGKGLEALLPGVVGLSSGELKGSVLSCGIEELRPGRYQARKTFTPADLAELAESIKKSGVIQPLLVRKTPNSGGYEIVAGERRWRAAQRAGLQEVPVLVRDFSDAEAAEVSLLENLQRENLNPVEEAEAYHRLIEEFRNTHDELAQKLGKDRSTITNALRLLKLSAAAREALIAGRISAGHARCLLGLSEADVEEALRAIAANGLSVRAVEAMLSKKAMQAQNPPSTTQVSGSAEFAAELARRLSSQLQTQVQVVLSRIHGKGKLVITFSSNEGLDQIVRTIHKGLETQKL
jgi:ParB family chromosome partitioning protein